MFEKNIINESGDPRYSNAEPRYLLEKTILGIIFNDNSLFESLELNPDWFKYKWPKQAIVNSLSDKTYLNPVTLVNKDDKMFPVLEVTSAQDIAFGYGSEVLANMVNELKDAYKKGIIKDIISNDKDITPENAVKKIQEKLSMLTDKAQAAKLKDVLNECYTQIEAACESRGVAGIKTGFNSLDNITGGLQGGCLYIIGARPSMGKSALATNIALNAAKSGRHVYMQWMEEPRTKLGNRMIANFASVPNEVLMRGKIHEKAYASIIKAIGDLGQLNITIDDSSSLSAESIFYKAQAINAVQKIDLLIVDHLQLIKQKGVDRRTEVSHASSVLKSIAKTLNIPVVVLCQLSRSVELDGKEKKPKLSHLKESGDIEANADVVMLLYRDSYYNGNITNGPDNIEIIVGKNRDGRCGSIFLTWHSSFMKFEEDEFHYVNNL